MKQKLYWQSPLAVLLIFGLLSACSTSKPKEEAENETKTEEPAVAAADAAPVDPDAPAAAPSSVPETASMDPTPNTAASATPDMATAAPEQTTPAATETAAATAETSVSPTAAVAETGSAVAAATTAVEAAGAVDAPVTEPVADKRGSGQYTKYRVREGETLMQIAFEVYGNLYSWRKIYAANQSKIPDHNHLTAGVDLDIEAPAHPVTIERNGERYLIKWGDTLGSISNDVYGTLSKWRKLWDNNRQMIRDPNKIFAGFNLYYVPERTLASVPAPAAPVVANRVPAGVPEQTQQPQ